MNEALVEIARSKVRMQLLHAMAGGAMSKQTRQQAVTSPRTTVRDNRRTLQELGVVYEEGSRRYTLTPRGIALSQGLDRLDRELDITDQFEEFLENIPFAECDLPLTDLEGAEHVRPCPSSPTAPADRLTTILTGADSAECVFPVVPNGLLGESAPEHVDVVLPSTIIDAVTGECSSQVCRLDIRTVDDVPPLGAALFSDRAVLFSTGPSGTFHSLVVSSSLTGWTQEFIEEWQAHAERVDTLSNAKS